MVDLAAGLGLAAGASGLYAVGVALQALEARAAPAEQALRLALFRRLVRRPRWLGGTLLGLAGWGLQALALTYVSLTLVQPALALGLVLLLVVAQRLLAEPVRRRELAAVAAIVAGVGALAWLAPAGSLEHAAGVRLWLPLAVIGLLALVPYAFRGGARAASALVPVSAGLAYAWDGLATKLASDDYGRHVWLGLAAWFVAMNVASGIGTLSEMSALQRRPVTQVAPVVFALTAFVPVALAPTLVAESWPSSPPRLAGLVASLLLVGIGALTLSASAPVGRLLAAREASSLGSGTARSPRVRSAAASLAVSDRDGAPAAATRTTTAPARSERSPSAR